jgi:hypothetical protein
MMRGQPVRAGEGSTSNHAANYAEDGWAGHRKRDGPIQARAQGPWARTAFFPPLAQGEKANGVNDLSYFVGFFKLTKHDKQGLICLIY